MKSKILIFTFVTLNLFAQDPFNTPVILPGANSNMSQAVIFGDYDKDGWTDLYLTKGNDANGTSYPNYLFKNINGTLTIQTIAGITDINLTSGSASWADIDKDGDLDLYVAGAQSTFSPSSKPDNNLFINNGNGTFTNATGNSTYGAITTDNEDSRHVGFGDYNNDGYPDVYVHNGVFGGGKANNSFYSNDGDGTFTRKTAAQLGNIIYEGTPSGSPYATWGSSFSWGDFNNDGYLDIMSYSGAGAPANILWQNNPSGGNFIEVTPSIMQPTQTSFYSGNWVDYDNDGDLDLFVCNIVDGSVHKNYLFRNASTPSVVSFEEVTGIGSIITDEYHSLSSVWFDFDNDGDLDLFVSNKPNNQSNIPSNLYRNDGVTSGFTFTKVKDYYAPGTTNDNYLGRGAATADINNDGFLDLVVARAGSPYLYTNSGSNLNKFAYVQLVGTGTTSRDAIGSRIKVTANIPEQSGNTTQLRELSGQSGGGQQNDLRQHFGFGTATKIDEIHAQWLNSTGGSTKDENVYTDLPTNKFMVFTQGDLNVTANVIKAQNFMYLFGNTDGSVEFTTADADGGSLTMLRTNSDPSGTFSGTTATSPDGSIITANAVYPDRYWTITQTNLSDFNSTVYFDASGLTGSPDLDKVVLMKRTNSGLAWSPLNTQRIGNTLYAENVNSFSEFAIGYQEAGVFLSIKIFIEGSYDENGDTMRVDINTDIPLTSPYSEDNRTVSNIPYNIADWVLVELRETPSGSAVASKSAFLRNDGKIVADDGTTEFIEMDAPVASYYIVVKHRNHLAIMSANKVTLSSSTSTLYDFTN